MYVLKTDVGKSISDQMTKEVQARAAAERRVDDRSRKRRRDVREVAPHVAAVQSGDRTFRFDEPLDQNKEPLLSGEVRFMVMVVDPQGQQKIMNLLPKTDSDLERAIFFLDYPNHIFFMSGKRDFTLLPGLEYNFLASPTPVYTKTEQDMEDPLQKVDLYGHGLKTMYIVKKSLQWTARPMRSPLVVTVFKYLSDMIIMREMNKKDGGRGKEKKSKGRKKKNDAPEDPEDFAMFDEEAIAYKEGDDGVAPIAADLLQQWTDRTAEDAKRDDSAALDLCTAIVETLECYISSNVGDDDSYIEEEACWTREAVLDLATSRRRQLFHSNDSNSNSNSGNGITQKLRNSPKIVFSSEKKYGQLVNLAFCHETAKWFYPYYSKSKILRIPASRLESMKTSLFTNPSLFCFYGAYAPLITENDKTLTVNLPELSEEKFDDICMNGELLPSEEEKLGVRIYRLLKEECVTHGHKFLPMWKIYMRVSASSTKLFNDAIEHLEEVKAIVCTPNPTVVDSEGEMVKAHQSVQFEEVEDKLVYLAITYVSQRMIMDGLEKVLRNYRKMMPVLMRHLTPATQYEQPAILRSTKYEPTDEPPMPTTSRCSEQIQSIEAIATYPACPILIMDGWGGSGKTTALRSIEALFPPNSCILLTAQAANAAACREKVSMNSMTMFMMTMLHAMTCSRSPHFDSKVYDAAQVIYPPEFESKHERDYYMKRLTAAERLEYENEMEVRGFRFPKGKCFLHHIQTLLIDEISLVDDEAFAAVIQILTSCGDLKRVVLCGDHRQKPQISYGCLMSDLTKGFPMLEYKHCHRFKCGTLFENARAIHEKRYSDIRFDDGAYSMIEVAEMPTYLGEHYLRGELEAIMRRHDIKASVDNMLITRTNQMRRIIGSLAREITFGDSTSFHRGQKIYLNATDYSIPPPYFISKQILVVSCVQDVVKPDRAKKSTMTREALVTLRSEVVDQHTYTGAPLANYSKTIRFLIAVPLGKDLDDTAHWIRIPFFGKHRRIVSDASCLTSHFVQGFETKKGYIFHTSQWDVADTNTDLFANVTRAAEKVAFISNHTLLKRMCENQEPARNSVLWAHLLQMRKNHTTQFLRKEHKKRRRQLFKEGKTPGNYRPLFHLKENPTDAELEIPPSEAAQRKAEEEGDVFDAAAMVRKADEEKEARIQRKIERMKKRREKEERNEK